MSSARRLLAAAGASCCAASVALAAYAMHGLQGEDSQRAALAALFAFGHGLALLLFAQVPGSRLRRIALVALAAGVVLFSGSLAAAALAGLSTALAPTGGGLLMLGWLVIAIDALRR